MRIVTPPKAIFLLVLVVMFGLAFADHLTSPTLQATAAPSELGNACAPCGAPCK